MAINNSEAVRFSNEKIRPVANKLAQAYNLARQVQDEWYARNLGELFPADGGVIEDGSETDGRPVIDCNAVLLLMSRLSEFTAGYEAGDNAKLNTVLQVAPNP